jgi:hypothetical protein
MAITLDGTNGINSSGVIVAPDGSASAPAITNDGDTNTGIFFPAADTIAFAEGGAEAMRIDSNSNVQIATTSNSLLWFNAITTGNRFRIEQNGAPAANAYVTQGLVRNSNDAESALLGFAKSCGTTAGSATIVNNNDNLGVITFQGADGTNYIEGARITAIVNGTPGADDMPGALLFSTTADGASTVTERMRIDSSGNLLVGSSTNSDYSEKFKIATGSSTQVIMNLVATGTSAFGAIKFRNGSGEIGSISYLSSGVAYNTSSDYRLKENIAPMTGALEKVAQLKPCTYTWKFDGSAGQGFIAHELQEIVPDCVSGEKDAVETYTDEDGNEQTRIKPQGIDTSFLVATLTAAIQELSAKNDALEARIAALEGSQT